MYWLNLLLTVFECKQMSGPAVCEQLTLMQSCIFAASRCSKVLMQSTWSQSNSVQRLLKGPMLNTKPSLTVICLQINRPLSGLLHTHLMGAMLLQIWCKVFIYFFSKRANAFNKYVRRIGCYLLWPVCSARLANTFLRHFQAKGTT